LGISAHMLVEWIVWREVLGQRIAKTVLVIYSPVLSSSDCSKTAQ
jgi:hypothetical protein